MFSKLSVKNFYNIVGVASYYIESFRILISEKNNMRINNRY